MGKPPYEDADALDLMRADADQVELPQMAALPTPLPEMPGSSGGFDVPSGVADLGGRVHVYLD
ncbi:MAG: hypothetical protein ACRDPQ_07510 [Nocardioidaceae bacterium]